MRVDSHGGRAGHIEDVDLGGRQTVERVEGGGDGAGIGAEGCIEVAFWGRKKMRSQYSNELSWNYWLLLATGKR